MLFLLREFVQNRFFTFFNDDPMARLLLTLLLRTLLILLIDAPPGPGPVPAEAAG